jgi:hypothetical protein
MPHSLKPNANYKTSFAPPGTAGNPFALHQATNMLGSTNASSMITSSVGNFKPIKLNKNQI